MKKFNQNNFWASYADLMTSLFFVMLILFVLSFVMFKNNSKDLKDKNDAFENQRMVLDAKINELNLAKDSLLTSNEKLKKIIEIDSALVKLDSRYFNYNKNCKRHELKVDIQFKFSQYNLNASYIKPYHQDLINAGKQLARIINAIKTKDNIRYLLIIEGRAGRYPDESENIRLNNKTRHLSYLRAKGLYDFWKKNNITFKEEICEVIVAGSGFFGQCRSNIEKENRRFVIQILPKIGKLEI